MLLRLAECWSTETTDGQHICTHRPVAPFTSTFLTKWSTVFRDSRAPDSRGHSRNMQLLLPPHLHTSALQFRDIHIEGTECRFWSALQRSWMWEQCCWADSLSGIPYICMFLKILAAKSNWIKLIVSLAHNTRRFRNLDWMLNFLVPDCLLLQQMIVLVFAEAYLSLHTLLLKRPSQWIRVLKVSFWSSRILFNFALDMIRSMNMINPFALLARRLADGRNWQQMVMKTSHAPRRYLWELPNIEYGNCGDKTLSISITKYWQDFRKRVEMTWKPSGIICRCAVVLKCLFASYNLGLFQGVGSSWWVLKIKWNVVE